MSIGRGRMIWAMAFMGQCEANDTGGNQLFGRRRHDFGEIRRVLDRELVLLGSTRLLKSDDGSHDLLGLRRIPFGSVHRLSLRGEQGFHDTGAR